MRNDYIYFLLKKYRENGVIIDTNLMLLIVIGKYDVNKISNFKRTLKYTVSDYNLMTNLIGKFKKVFTTPNIMTEVDNLTRQLPSNEHEAATKVAKEVFSSLVEIYSKSSTICDDTYYSTLGITDTHTRMLTHRDLLVVTDDFLLSQTIQSSGRDVININHVRTF